jgi:hypothetical protein
MKYGLKISDRHFQLTETASGLLDLDSGEALTPDTIQPFHFDEIGLDATLEIQGSPGPLTSRAYHYRFLVKAARILSYYDAGATFKAAVWINHDFVNDLGYLTILANMLGEASCHEIFFEYALGAYGNRDIAKTNTARLIGGMPADMKEAARQWYGQAETFATRAVGFGFRKHRFTLPGPDDDSLILAAGDPVFVVREPGNSHDPQAVSLLWKNGEKFGYLRRNIACHIASLMDQGRLYTGRIAAVLGHYREDDERVCVQIGEGKEKLQ